MGREIKLRLVSKLMYRGKRPSAGAVAHCYPSHSGQHLCSGAALPSKEQTSREKVRPQLDVDLESDL